MKRIIVFAAICATVAAISLSSCKNTKTDNSSDGQTNKEAEVKTLDVDYLATLFCKGSDEPMAKIYLGEEKDNLFAVSKDIRNRYSKVYGQFQYENSIEFRIWDATDGTKILGVNLIEESEDSRRLYLNFYRYDVEKDTLVPDEALNNKIEETVKALNTSLYVFRVPTEQSSDDIILGYWKNEDDYEEIILHWDGTTFNR